MNIDRNLDPLLFSTKTQTILTVGSGTFVTLRFRLAI